MTRPHMDFALILRLHTPIIMPRAVPRLDILLQEAMSRLHQDWETAHVLPLARCDEAGVYCASQLVLAITPDASLTSTTEALVSTVTRQDLHLTRDCKTTIRHTGPDANRMTSHQGITAPFAIFYGRGDAEACAELMTLLSGIGREHARHYGAFSVERVQPDEQANWRLRPWPVAQSAQWEDTGHRFIEDHLMLNPCQASEPVMRPRRLIREVLHVR